MSAEQTWVTPEAHRRLSDELAELQARGDADTDVRARIVELSAVLSNVQIGTRPDDGLVESGMHVTVRGEDDTDIEFVLGDRALLGDALDDGATVLSAQSPLGAAVDGHYVGDSVTFDAPRGTRTVRIIAATPVG